MRPFEKFLWTNVLREDYRMKDKNEVYSHNKNPLNTIQKSGFWLLISSFIFGCIYIYLQFLLTKSWDTYYEAVKIIESDFWYYIVTSDVYFIFALLGFLLLFLNNTKSKKVIIGSVIVFSIFIMDKILSYFDVWSGNQFYRDYNLVLVLLYYLFLGTILWIYYKKNSRSKVIFYIFSYCAISILILIINANIISLGKNETVFNFLYFSAMISLLVAAALEIHFLMKHHLIININSRGEEKMGTYENRISNIILTTGKTYVVLSVIGAFFLLGFLEDFDNTMKFSMIVVGLGYSFLFSLIFFGAAEVIELLHQQNKKTEELIRIQKNCSHPIETVIQKPVSADFEDLPDL